MIVELVSPRILKISNIFNIIPPLQIFQKLSSINFTWSIHEYFYRLLFFLEYI